MNFEKFVSLIVILWGIYAASGNDQTTGKNKEIFWRSLKPWGVKFKKKKLVKPSDYADNLGGPVAT